mmetsp:Transcript_30113/g.66756  ORF Transcript_30113/g.66756 Transcript_30113/m.66756 type:complete len:237 (-) Transcript_30113:1021-1731(-)
MWGRGGHRRGSGSAGQSSGQTSHSPSSKPSGRPASDCRGAPSCLAAACCWSQPLPCCWSQPLPCCCLLLPGLALPCSPAAAAAAAPGTTPCSCTLPPLLSLPLLLPGPAPAAGPPAPSLSPVLLLYSLPTAFRIWLQEGTLMAEPRGGVSGLRLSAAGFTGTLRDTLTWPWGCRPGRCRSRRAAAWPPLLLPGSSSSLLVSMPRKYLLSCFMLTWLPPGWGGPALPGLPLRGAAAP